MRGSGECAGAAVCRDVGTSVRRRASGGEHIGRVPKKLARGRKGKDSRDTLSLSAFWHCLNFYRAYVFTLKDLNIITEETLKQQTNPVLKDKGRGLHQVRKRPRLGSWN